MENPGGTARSLRLVAALISCTVSCLASDPPLPKPIATLALAEMNSFPKRESDWVTITFLSESSIAVGRCRHDCASKECSLAIVRWENGTLRPTAQTAAFDSGLAIHPAGAGKIFAGQPWLPTTVEYSADLSSVRNLPIHLWDVSPSGAIVAEGGRNSWKLFRLTDGLETLRVGTGDIPSVSDEAMVIREGKAIRVETLDGKRLGSFSVSDEVWGFHAGLLGTNKLYLPDCGNTVRVVDFAGKKQLTIKQPGLCGQGDTGSSADGRRILFDFTGHKTSGLQHVLESIQTITSLGMIGPEDYNREEVRVFDTVTGESCFEWHRSFPMTYRQIRSAAISPSGELVAITEGNALSIYRLPAVCEGRSDTPGK